MQELNQVLEEVVRLSGSALNLKQQVGYILE